MSETPAPRRAVSAPLPWHAPLVTQLQSSWRSQRMPHALLIHGLEGLGKRAFAEWLAKALLCEQNAGLLQPCGNCASCLLAVAESHPDRVRVAPEEDKKQISVDQVRALSERLAMTSYRQGYKVAIIDPAHMLTPGAANSLLKTLEEPTPRSVLVLLTSHPAGLLATIRSRCQKLGMHRPTADVARDWLNRACGRELSPALLDFVGGAPLRALDYADGSYDQLDEAMRRALEELLSGRSDVTQVAPKWADETLVERLNWLDGWLAGLIRQEIAGTADPVTHGLRPAALPRRDVPLNISGVYILLDRLRELRAQLMRTALQRELAIESLLLGMLDVLNPRQP